MYKTLKVYLKCRRKPIVYQFEKEAKADEFYKMLMTNDIVKFGPVIFERSQFNYAIID